MVHKVANFMVTKTFRLDEALFEVLNNDWRLDVLKESVTHLGKPNSTKDLCEFIIRTVNKK